MRQSWNQKTPAPSVSLFTLAHSLLFSLDFHCVCFSVSLYSLSFCIRPVCKLSQNPKLGCIAFIWKDKVNAIQLRNLMVDWFSLFFKIEKFEVWWCLNQAHDLPTSFQIGCLDCFIENTNIYLLCRICLGAQMNLSNISFCIHRAGFKIGSSFEAMNCCMKALNKANEVVYGDFWTLIQKKNFFRSESDWFKKVSVLVHSNCVILSWC